MVGKNYWLLASYLDTLIWNCISNAYKPKLKKGKIRMDVRM